MNKREILKELKRVKKDVPAMTFESWDDEDEKYNAVYIGSFMSLDPCGRYHHAISPNSVKQSCINFWDRLDECANELDAWIESGEGDPTDIYFCWPIEEGELEYEEA